MKVTHPKLARRFLAPMDQQSFPYVCGRTLPRVRAKSSKKSQPRAASAECYIDWVLRDWPARYRNEREPFLKIPYQGNSFLLPEVALLDNSDRLQNPAQIKVNSDRSLFRLSHGVRKLTKEHAEQLKRELRKKGKYHNGRNLRMVEFKKLKKNGGKFAMRVQPLNYADYVATNLVLDAGASGEPTLRERLLKRWNCRLEGLKNSPLGNALGIDVLLFSADGWLVLQRRSRAVAVRPGEFSSSFSGNLTPADIRGAKTLGELNVMREGREEIGVGLNDIEKHSLHLLGIGREIIRGGQPGLFYCARTSLSRKAIRARARRAKDRREVGELALFYFGRDALESLQGDAEIGSFLKKIDKFIERFGADASISLLAALAFWIGQRCGAVREKSATGKQILRKRD